MPAAIDEQTRRKVIQQWISGCPRDKIAEENNIGAGTVSSIVSNYKIGLENLEFDYLRELAVEIRKQGLNLADKPPLMLDYTTILSNRGQPKMK
jgi:hypothetical protein